MAEVRGTQELRRATELRTQLRAVSEAGSSRGRGYRGQRGQPGRPSEPRAEDLVGVCLFVLQLAEVLSRCSHNITEAQMSMGHLSLELAKNRDQVHEDRRSVGFPSRGGWGTQLERASSRVSPLSWQGCWAMGQRWGSGMHQTLP